ncbi:MAG: DUF4831 family protein [Marinifilaceae bacterium]
MKNLLNIVLLICGVLYFGTLQAANDKRKGTLTTPAEVVYALPQTVLDVEVVAEKTIQKRGPLADYAEKYMGLRNIITSDQVVWKIKGIRILSHPEVDPTQFHKIRTVEDYDPNLVSLDPSGLITGFNVEQAAKASEEIELIMLDKEQGEMTEYGRFALDHNLKFKEDTTFKIVETDTAFVKVPVLEKQGELKSNEEKAEEAAHQIYKLRKRRFKILTANFELLPPDGKAYEVIVRELGKLENDYLSLFAGKSSKQIETFRFSYVPAKKEKSGVIFRMSPERGPVNRNDLSGRPIMMELEDLNVTRDLTPTTTEEVTQVSKINYRVPGCAVVKVVNGKKVLGQKKMQIAQFGKILSYPADVLVNEGYRIEFHPELGSIKNISKQ